MAVRELRGFALLIASGIGRSCSLSNCRKNCEKIRAGMGIANPGCHASGFVALIAPLVQEGMLSPDAALSCFSLTGYSGGMTMIGEY